MISFIKGSLVYAYKAKLILKQAEARSIVENRNLIYVDTNGFGMAWQNKLRSPWL